MEAVLGPVVVLLEPHQRALGAVLVGRHGRLAAPHHAGLGPLAPHHRAQSAAAVEVLELVHDGGEAHAPLAGDPGLQHANALVPELLLEPVLDVTRELAPVRPGVLELDLTVLDPQIDGMIGLPANGHTVPARGPELDRKSTRLNSSHLGTSDA